MRRRFFWLALFLFHAAGVGAAAAQLPRAELLRRLEAARASSEFATVLEGATAARLLGDHAEARQLLARSTDALQQADEAWVNEMIFSALASGQGVNGMQRALREARTRVRMTPVQIASVANTFPALLVGGEFDQMILSLSADHPDPAYRCSCQAEKAWVHRVAGREHESRILWGELVAAWDRNPLEFEDPDAQANWQGQYARNLARAGRLSDARAALAEGMDMPVSDAAKPMVQRRWAQTYAELGEVEQAIALLEPLIQSSTLVTVNSLATRYTWEPMRQNLAFQEMLDRHR